MSYKVSMKTIPVSWPSITNKELNALKKVMEEGWLGLGSYVEKFESDLAKFLKLKKNLVCCVSTGSDALVMSLILANVKPGDEVILPSLNFVASAQAIKLLGAHPVFCDVEEDTLCLDINKLKKLISSKTKAIISVDYSGNIANYEKINKIKKIKKKKIRIIQDAAHSFASSFKGKKIGSTGDIVMFSFDPIKTITCIDGGAIIVRDFKELKKLKAMRQLGFEIQPNVAFNNQKGKMISDVKSIGLQNRMSNVHAAVGIQQLKKIREIVKKKTQLALNYNKFFENNNYVITPRSNFKNVIPFIYYIRVKSKFRDKLRNYLKKNHINTGLHWTPNHLHSFFKKCKKGELNITNKVTKELISLPYYCDLSKKKQGVVVKKINEFFSKIN
tara:strand:+ start:12240 stop:13400 length:1161 start_codon:yes stop_codon:yes gene_type:complete